MRYLAAAVLGYGIGIIPTAILIASRAGFDLRNEGSGNPGANNALRLGGLKLAAAVLFTEMAKGALAAVVGLWIGGEAGLVIAGLSAIAGNLYNIVYRFRGGKGLAIAAGVILAAWPAAFIPVILVMALTTWLIRASDPATQITIIMLWVMAFSWRYLVDLRNPWGLEDSGAILGLAIGIGVLISPRHLASFRKQEEPSPA